jgi:hypothetical protein
MTAPIRRPALLLAAAAAAVLGCRPAPRSPAEQEIVAAIQRYNEALPQAYARADPGLLATVATPDEARRVDDLIGFLAQGKMVMDARQEQAETRRVRLEGPDRATAEVTEIWWYRHWVPSTGEVKQAPRRVRYENRYQLVRVQGRWLVDRLVETGYAELK